MQVNKALAEAAAARRELDAQKAISRAQKEQQQILEDQRIKDEIDIKKLTNELADKNGQLAAVQRKLVLMRANRCWHIVLALLQIYILLHTPCILELWIACAMRLFYL